MDQTPNKDPNIYRHRLQERWLEVVAVTIVVTGVLHIGHVPTNYLVVLSGAILFVISMLAKIAK